MTSSKDDVSFQRRFVVGVDGSEDSKEALRWAANEARERGGVVHAILVWQVPSMALIGPYVPPDLHAITKRAAETTLAACLAAVADDLAGVPVHSDAIEGVTTQVLEAASEKADLLVVGSRGHGKVSRIILGSVSKHLSVHAPCPVVVVPRRQNRCSPTHNAHV
jgi:nucleotide-binding universal stress UspA family protein